MVEFIGRGGMGAVYKARQASLDRFVAVKVLRDDHAVSQSFVDRFSREARAAAAVVHPNIIEVYDVGQERGYWYLAMELVDGESLAAVLRRGERLSPQQVLDYLRQTAAAAS